MEIMGIRIPTVVSDNVALRCDGCLEVIDGTPWRVNVLDTVAAETPVSWAGRPVLNPGPFQFHRDEAHVRAWMAARGWFFCRRGQVREIMRPVPLPGEGQSGAPGEGHNEAQDAPRRWGLCDGLHRDDHEFIPA